MRQRVAIVGGGIAGLSAAHELVERGFAVDLYERRSYFGGKAASYRVPHPGCARAAPNGLPGEHGFRFFPGWYRHVTDTMSRIPYHRAGGGCQTVGDNLVSVKSNLLAWFDRSPLNLPLRMPSSVKEALDASQVASEFSGLGFTKEEAALFLRKMLEFLVLSDQKREEKLEQMTWWDYLECSKPGRSRAYQDLVRATTRTMVAAKAEQVSAFTIGRLAIRTLLDTMSTVDRVLNGPTDEVWIGPWVAHLAARGVKFHRGKELRSIAFTSASRKVKHLTLESVEVGLCQRLRRRIAQIRSGDQKGSFYAEDIWSGLRELAAYTDAPLVLEAAQLDGSQFEAATADIETGLTLVEAALAEVEKSPAYSDAIDVVANYYVLALPLEQLAYYVNRTTMLTHLDPDLRQVIRLSRELDWMAGIQFYFSTPLDIAPGHLVGLDSDWGLTAIEHTQFWEDVNLPSGVRSILSVDIADWNKPGRKIRKAAVDCTPQEIAREVWAQLGEMLNRPDRLPLLRKSMLVTGRLERDVSYHLDDSIVERYDRKKQAAYERARGVHFSTLSEPANELAEEKSVESFMWGPRKLLNAEPLLINRVGTRRWRPEACTGVSNLFLAGDYVKTETDLACMEGANEAARRAVNGILNAASSREARCVIWPFSPSRQAIEAVLGIAGPMQAVRNVTKVVATLQERFFKSFTDGA